MGMETKVVQESVCACKSLAYNCVEEEGRVVSVRSHPRGGEGRTLLCRVGAREVDRSGRGGSGIRGGHRAREWKGARSKG